MVGLRPPPPSSGRLRALAAFFPAYDEETNVERVVGDALEVIVADDGSRDRTGEIADRLARSDPRVRVVHHPTNRGYGGALRSEFAAATKERVFYTDGDGQFELREVGRLVPLLAESDVVTGYPANRRDPALRKLNAFLNGRVLVPFILGLRVRDVNCAFKIYPRDLFRQTALWSEGALIDAEVLVRALRLGYRIGEVPVTHYPRQAGRQTGANLSVILRMFREVFRLRRSILEETPLSAPDAKPR